MTNTTMARRTKVLIAEDHDAHAAWIWHVLEQAGYAPTRVAVAELASVLATGSAAVAIAAVDPGHSGQALLADLVGHAVTRNRGIIALCRGSRRAHDQLRRAGAGAVLGTPVSPHELLAEMARLTSTAPRYSIDVGVTLLPSRGGEGLGATGLNVSDTGILVSCPGTFAVGDGLLLHAEVPRGTFTLRSHIVRRAQERGPDYWGLRFDHSSVTVRTAMSYFGLVP